MIEHIVLFRWTESATPEAIKKAVDGLRGMKGHIDGIVDVSCGADFSGRTRGFTHGLVVRFESRAALEAYEPHPEHQRVVQNFIEPIKADVMACDYEL